MAFRGLADFVKNLEEQGELIRIKEYVNPVYDIAEITDRVCKQSDGGKALLFENTGTSFPVLTNAFGSDRRMALALGIANPDDAAREINSLFKQIAQPMPSLAAKLKMLPTLRKVAQWLPRTVSGRAVCQEVIIRNPDLGLLPILKCWPHDGGRFITLPMVNTQDPLTGIRNVGMYRMQVFTENSTGMHWHRHKTGARHFAEYKKMGKRMPIAVVLGGDPVYTYAATAPLPDNMDEYLLAGFLRNERVKLVKGITVDLYVPHDADFVIEGFVDPQEDLAWEGPFGDHTGFYSLADWYPKFHVTCITHRKDAIFPATIVGVPPMEDVYMARATERIFLSPIKITMLPELVDMNLPIEGVAHNIALVSIEKSYPAQAYKVGHALWGAGQMMFNKIAVVVDSTVDVHNIAEVAKAVTENYNPLLDTLLGRGPLDILDHSSSRPSFGGKLLIDATVKHHEELGFGLITQVPNFKTVLHALTDAPIGVSAANVRLLEMGISILVVSVDKTVNADVRLVGQNISATLADNLPQMVIFLDDKMPLANLSTAVWYVSGNTDPERDCFFVEVNGVKASCLFIDGTKKTKAADGFMRDWPSIVTSDADTVRRIDDRWDTLGLGTFIESPSKQFFGVSSQTGAIEN